MYCWQRLHFEQLAYLISIDMPDSIYYLFPYINKTFIDEVLPKMKKVKD